MTGYQIQLMGGLSGGTPDDIGQVRAVKFEDTANSEIHVGTPSTGVTTGGVMLVMNPRWSGGGDGTNQIAGFQGQWWVERQLLAIEERGHRFKRDYGQEVYDYPSRNTSTSAFIRDGYADPKWEYVPYTDSGERVTFFGHRRFTISGAGAIYNNRFTADVSTGFITSDGDRVGETVLIFHTLSGGSDRFQARPERLIIVASEVVSSNNPSRSSMTFNKPMSGTPTAAPYKGVYTEVAGIHVCAPYLINERYGY